MTDKLKQLFGEKGEVTDVQLKYSAEGEISTLCVHMGTRTGSTTVFDKTFVGASRIAVELCHSLGEKPKPMSKVVRERQKAEKELLKKTKSADEEDEAKPPKKKRKEDEILEKCEQDPDFLEFLQAHKKTAATWGNDTLVDELMKLKEKKEKKKEGKRETEVEGLDEDAEEVEMQGKKKKLKTTDSTVKKGSRKRRKKKSKLEAEFFTLKLRDVPKKARKKDIKAFFAPLKLKSIRFPVGLRGIVFVGFGTETDQIKGLQKNKSFLMGNQVKIRAHNPLAPQANAAPKGKFEQLKEELDKVAEPIGESGRIFLRNLSYTTNEDEVTKLFGEFGPITEIHLPLDKITRKLKGFGFVSFMMPEHADNAFRALDGTIFEGRMLHLLPANPRMSLLRKRHKPAPHSKLKRSTIAKVISEKYGISREEMLLDKTDEQDSRLASVGVRMALAETEIVADTKKFLEENGVCLEAFDSNDKKAERSKTVILAKNLPANTSANDLKQLFLKHGVLNRIILPPSGVTGIVEFAEPAEARAAFRKLAYTKFFNLPLYLEWAPIGVFALPADAKQVLQLKADAKMLTVAEEAKKITPVEPVAKIMTQVEEFEPVDENAVPELDTTLFHFIQCGPVYAATVARKKDPSNPDVLLSMGYGFVQYYRSKDASKALTTLNGTMLENHILELKPSTRTLVKESADSTKKKAMGSKLLVRNVPFQATQEEITDLFKTFGKLKAVRLPKKMTGGGEHRGFGFIDFYTESDAKKAFDTLSKSTHLYGRRLVIEWASQDETIEDLRAKTARLASHSKDGVEQQESEGGSTKQKLSRYFQTHTMASKADQDEEEDEG
ncbi:putative RNA-binding protein 19 [Orchesella cincta]|uniref:Putative RNA-binding protein 19 n=1 Tax=Orchesella cincta TaxID=48709 RepID=A0A1D2N0Z6_ORCCI|nr:putative RNA-binding protein 19 [Orchesella cincta]